MIEQYWATGNPLPGSQQRPTQAPRGGIAWSLCYFWSGQGRLVRRVLHAADVALLTAERARLDALLALAIPAQQKSPAASQGGAACGGARLARSGWGAGMSASTSLIRQGRSCSPLPPARRAARLRAADSPASSSRSRAVDMALALVIAEGGESGSRPSNREIAERCGVAHHLVADRIGALGESPKTSFEALTELGRACRIRSRGVLAFRSRAIPPMVLTPCYGLSSFFLGFALGSAGTSLSSGMGKHSAPQL